MSFHRQRLQQLRTAARLGNPIRRRSVVRYIAPTEMYPMPSFHVPGKRNPGDRDVDYIDSRYFSPEALRWADAVTEFRANGGTLSQDDEECFARVWEAMRAGRKPTSAQQRESEKDWKWRQAQLRVPELYAKEMNCRGAKNYGPDAPLPDDLKGPGSARELIYKYLYKELGYKTPDSASTAHNEWRKARGIGDGMA